MKKKSRKTVHGTLKTGVIILITDPAEQAELDRRCREAEKTLAGGRSTPRKARPRDGK